MYLCRIAWHNLVPLARVRSSSRLVGNMYRNASIRQMSSGGPPGSSSENMVYALMIGAVIAGGSVYTYKVLRKDKARYNERVAEIMERPKSEWTAWQPKKSDQVQSPEVVESSGEPSESVTEEVEVPAAESAEQPESSVAVVEPNESPSEGEAASEEEVIEVLLPPASAKEPDEVQSPEVVEAAGEVTELVTEEAKVPVAETIEQPESPSTVAEPKDVPLEGETETSVAVPKE
ncbi:protein MGARP isoform X2 [Carcharodon carcharias]|uniref:protein MGARP isoform X2 n=1 Tax=Carcharodon carcharias TaxID=13397 RepID=UPI001B7F02BA|nr:protein MGARP isoform X2 [Carcharodon carcharias]